MFDSTLLWLGWRPAQRSGSALRLRRGRREAGGYDRALNRPVVPCGTSSNKPRRRARHPHPPSHPRLRASSAHHVWVAGNAHAGDPRVDRLVGGVVALGPAWRPRGRPGADLAVPFPASSSRRSACPEQVSVGRSRSFSSWSRNQRSNSSSMSPTRGSPVECDSPPAPTMPTAVVARRRELQRLARPTAELVAPPQRHHRRRRADSARSARTAAPSSDRARGRPSSRRGPARTCAHGIEAAVPNRPGRVRSWGAPGTIVFDAPPLLQQGLEALAQADADLRHVLLGRSS